MRVPGSALRALRIGGSAMRTPEAEALRGSDAAVRARGAHVGAWRVSGPAMVVGGAPRTFRTPVRVPTGRISAARHRMRRAVAVVALALASAAVVVGLGLVAGAAGDAHVRAAVPAGAVQVAVEPGESIWDVARRTVPGAGPAGAGGTAAVVERIAADNALPVDAAPLPTGLVLRVPA
ncbi:hypothetical protein LWC35_11180 [Pseudonocardia kujensis]|uniref:hypothetical protein n=1 Tax=Pseudonocardia kujensis TaxID=1128675 RepID=UPI001E31EF6E|nr:hypothetical protein [Pseudonocardia kujensis]MCE0763462.1 hypothetical protein [Pseudonocardia kujensis]